MQFPMLSSCLSTILNTPNLMKKQGGSVQTASRALQLFLYDYSTLASAHWYKFLTSCDGQSIVQIWLFCGQSEQNMTNLHLTLFSKSMEDRLCLIYSGCHCISRHAIIAFPAEIQHIPNESHSAYLTITGHTDQLPDQQTPSTTVNSEEKRSKIKRGIFCFLNSM